MDLVTVGKVLTGLAMGDALGATSEFKSPGEVLTLLEKHGPAGWPFTPVGGGLFGWRPGQGTDDSDMALSIATSMARLGRFDVDDMAQEFVKWYSKAPKDVGNTTSNVLSAIRRGERWEVASLSLFRAKPANSPNGGLMRNGVAVAAAETLDQAFLFSSLQCMVTHYHPMCVLTCCMQAWLMWELFNGNWPFAAHADWVAEFHKDYTGWADRCKDHRITTWLREVEVGGVLSDAMAELTGDGHDGGAEFDPDVFNPYAGEKLGTFSSLYTLQVAVWALQWSHRDDKTTFEQPFPAKLFERRGVDVLGWIALIGDDSDTYGAAAGPLIAAAHKAAFDPAAVVKLEVVRVFAKHMVQPVAGAMEGV